MSKDSWPPKLDAVLAAPEHHRVLLENEHVRVLETRIRPGETTALHTHQHPAATTILSWADMVRRDEHGAVLLDTRGAAGPDALPATTWTPPLGPHTLTNVGAEDIHVIAVEIKGR